MANNPKDMFGTNNTNDNSKNRFKSNKVETFDLFNINVNKAEKDVDTIFNYAKKSASDFNKYYIKATQTSIKTVADMTVSTYSKVYTQLESMHKSYLSNVVSREISAANDVANAWANARGDFSKNNKTPQPTAIGNNSNTVSSPSMSDFMKTLDTSLGNKFDNFSRRIDKLTGIVNDVNSSSNSDSNSQESLLPSTTEDKKVNVLKDIGNEFLSAAKKAIGEITDILKSGITNYESAYENSFTQISTRMDTNYADTRKYYADEIGKVYDNNMQSVINISSDLIPAMQAVAQQGLKGDTALAKAYGDATANILMPWLETNSEAFVNLSANLSEQNINSLKGQQLQLQETQSGNRLLQSGVINSLTNELAPLLTNIDLNTGGADNLSAEYTAVMEQLVNQGMSTSDAYAQVQTMIKSDKNLYDAISSGSTSERMYAANRINGMDSASSYVDMTNTVKDIMNSASGEAERGAVKSVLGYETPGDWTETYNQTGIIDTDSLKESIEKYSNSDEALNAYNQMLANSEESLTATKKFTNKLENSTASTAGYWITSIPLGSKWFTIVMGLLSGILGATVFNKGTLSNLSNNLGSKLLNTKFLSGLSSKISSAGTAGASGTIKGALSTAGSYAAGAAAPGAVGLLGVGLAGIGVKNLAEASNKSKTASSSESGALTGQKIGSGLAIGGGLTAAGASVAGISAGISAAGAGAGALGAATAGLAAIPGVGWAALAVAGLGVGIAKVSKHFSELDKGINEINDSFDKTAETLKQERETRLDQIDSLKDSFKEAETTEEKRQILVEEGVVTQEEASKMTSTALENTMKEYTKTSRNIEKGSKAGEKAYENLQKYSKEKLEDEKKQGSEDIIKALGDLSDSDATSKLEEMGLDNYISKGLGKGKYSASELAEMAKSDPEKLNKLLNKNQGLFGWNGSYMDSLDTDDLNTVYSNLGIDKTVTTATESAETASEIQDAIDTLKGVKKSKSKPTGNNLTEYRKAREFLLQSDTQELLDESGITGFDTSTINSTYPKYASGNPYVVSDQLAYIHQGEAVLTKEQNKKYRNVATSIPVLNSVINGLFNKTNSSVSSSSDSSNSASDIISNMNSGINKLIDAILSLKSSDNTDSNTNNYVNIAEPVKSSYSSSIINLVSEMT